MTMFASWIHGNAVVGEPDNTGAQPDNVYNVTHFGWGTIVKVRPGFSRWCHIPLPTPVISSDQRLKLVRFFLLWKVDQGGSLDDVHLYDGSRFVTGDYANQDQAPFRFVGDHTQIDKLSTFELRDPVTCGVGFGISFNINAFYTTGPVSPDIAFTVTAAGGDYMPV